MQPDTTPSAKKQPPLLPNQWSSSYISYWLPMQPEDDITSGICWFDYTNNICRIDGLFNPWTEKKMGHRLWMSEIMAPEQQRSHKTKIAYQRQSMHSTSEFIASPPSHTSEDCDVLILPQDILQRYHAEHQGEHTLLGHTADVWHFHRPNKGPATYYLKQGTNQLLRMVTGDPEKCASVRDFPNFNENKIEACIFDTSGFRES